MFSDGNDGSNRKKRKVDGDEKDSVDFDAIGTFCYAISGTANKAKSMQDFKTTDPSTSKSECAIILTLDNPISPTLASLRETSTFESSDSLETYLEDLRSRDKEERIANLFKITALERARGLEGGVLTRMSTKEYVKL